MLGIFFEVIGDDREESNQRQREIYDLEGYYDLFPTEWTEFF
jgi:hypothetical protein